MSGYADGAILEKGVLEAGTEFLEKPFSFAALTEKVRSSSTARAFGEYSLCRRAALLAPCGVPVAPIASAISAPCVLASKRLAHPDDERHSTNLSPP